MGYVTDRNAPNIGAIGKIICLLCGRHKFSHPGPHKCNHGFRKRHIRWFTIKCVE